jgi:MFS family permease
VAEPRKRARETLDAFFAVARNRNLRSLELGFATSLLGHYAYLVAVSVYAYDVGGEAAVGLIFLARLIPSACFAPFAAMLGDRYPRELVLVWTNVVRIVLVAAAAAAVYADTSPTVVYVLAVAATIATTPFRSAVAALTPSIAKTPTELTAANAVGSGLDSIAVFVGPALAGLMLAVASTALVFALTAVLLAISLILILRIKVERDEAPRGEMVASTIVSEAFAGFRAIGRHPSLRVMLGIIGAETAAAGAIQVYIVVLAVEVLDYGTSGVGFLNSAIGIGAFLGATIALSLSGAQRLSPAFISGAVFWGLPLVVLGLWPNPTLALVMFGVIGLANSVGGVAGFTLVQRTVPNEVLARVFGVIQMLWLTAMGIGAATAPVLIAWLGVETALVVTGAFLVLLAAVSWPRVRGIDAAAAPPRTEEMDLLTSIPIFAPLPGGSIENLATRLVPLRIERGDVIIRQGDEGDRFFIVAEGELDVLQDGVQIGEMKAGDYFGEIALLRDTPRTATVSARTDAVLYGLDREEFLAAVTGHPQSAEAAEGVMSVRLAGPAGTGYQSGIS